MDWYCSCRKKIRQRDDNKYIIREIQVLDKLRHPNVISIMAVSVYFQDCYILMEHFESENLRTALFKDVKSIYNLDLKKRNLISLQLCQAVSFLHNSSPAIVHKDIKPENILVNVHYQLKLCDMGFSKYDGMPSELCSTVGNHHGTLLYMAPEQLFHEQTCSTQSDVWALACVVVEIYSEKFVWVVHFGFDFKEQLAALIEKKAKPTLDKIPKQLKRVLSGCFDANPFNRPKAGTLLDIIILMNSDDSDSDSA